MDNSDKLNKSDILQILTLIRANYENAYANTSDEEAALLVQFWHESLKPYPKTLVFEGTKNAIRNSEFPPRLATILNEIKKLTAANEPTFEELWAELNGVLGKVYDISRYLCYPQHYKQATDKIESIFKNLSRDLQLYLVTPSALIELSEMSQESLTFEKARFFKSMPPLRKNLQDRTQAQQFLAICEQKTKINLLENKKSDT
jgi:hypothetical protein